MPNFDFICHECRVTFEELVPFLPDSRSLPCPRCHQPASMVWLRSPGMKPDPYWSGVYDPGLGATINSNAHKRALLAERGLMEMPAREFTRRAEEAPVSPEPEFLKTEEERREFRETAEKTWNDIKYGNVEVPKLKTVDDIVDAPPAGA